MSGYFGWVGIQALNVADYLARPMLDLPQNPRKDLGRMDNWFIMGDFVKDPNARTSKYIQRYYDMQREINEVYAAYNNARKMGDYDRAREFASSDLAKYHGMAKDANRTMAKITVEIRRLENDRSLNMDEKRVRLDRLYLDRNRLAATFEESVSRQVGLQDTKSLHEVGLKTTGYKTVSNISSNTAKSKGLRNTPKPLCFLAPRTGLEPVTCGLTVRRSTD